MEARVINARVDTHPQRFDIANARRLIYEAQYSVDGAATERLDRHSLLPSSVSNQPSLVFAVLDVKYV